MWWEQVVICYWCWEDTVYYYINTNEIPGELSRENMISSHIKISCYVHMWKYQCCYGYIINGAWPLGDTKFIFSCWKYFTRSLSSLVKYFPTLEDKFCISMRPCNILYLFNKSAFFNCPFLNILLAKSRHGVMYNYYFFSHGWLHITPSILLPDTTLMENDWVWLAIASEVQRQPLK